MTVKKIISVSLILLISGSCAYFNTFYNAQEKFKQAENAFSELEKGENFPRKISQDYEVAAMKALKVIDNFPESQWVDDAMYIFAVSNFRLEKFLVAQKMFRRLTIEFPASPFYQESMLWIARCSYMSGEKQLAFDMLQRFTEDDRNRMFFGEAMMLYAQLAVEEGNIAGADTAYIRALDLIIDKGRKAAVHYEYATHLINTDRLDKALPQLAAVEELSLERDLLGRVQLQYAKIFRLQKNYSASEELLKNMLLEDKYSNIYSDLELELAEIYRNLGDFDRAIERNKTVTETYPNTMNAAVAAYRIAEIYLYDLGDLEKAKEYYQNTIKHDKNAFEASEARNMIRTISRFTSQQGKLTRIERKTPALVEDPVNYYEMMQDSAKTDSAAMVELQEYEKAAEDYAAELISQAEILSFTFGLYDSSLSIYRKIAEKYPFISIKARLLYIRAWVQENENKDSSAADSLYSILLQDYPETVWAAYAKGVKDSTQIIYENDQKLLFSIEDSINDSSDIKAVIPELRGIMPSMRDSLTLSQTWYYIAWLFDHELDQLDSALQYYQVAADSFPGTEHADMSRQRIVELTDIINQIILEDSTEVSSDSLTEAGGGMDGEDVAP